MNRCTFLLSAFYFFSQSLFAQTDTVPPVLTCKQGINLPILPTQTVSAWATDFIDTVYDNQTSGLIFGVRKTCTGSGFPENQYYVTFFDIGNSLIEVWARDSSGNAASCLSHVDIVDPYGNVGPGTNTIAVITPGAEGIDSVNIKVFGVNCLNDTVDYQVSTPTGWWLLSPGTWIKSGIGAIIVPAPGYNSAVIPSKNINPLNGVSTNDLVQIQKHILGIQLLGSPYKIIAADANQDGKVTTFDVIVLRKLILGITNELPNGKLWRFVPQDYVFSDPANPFQPVFPERIEVPNTADPAPSLFRFTGVKIGDVDYSADPGQ